MTDISPLAHPALDTLNYHHLRYAWIVAREGGLVAAGRRLRLSHSTLSAQIRALEDTLGEPLFTRTGRRLVLTELGRIVCRYADEIFALGDEMVATVRGRPSGRPPRLRVGIVDVVPKLVVRRLLAPALALAEPVRLSCHEAPYDQLLADLARHALDLVIADAPVPPGSSVRAFHHQLGDSGVSVFGTPALVRRHRDGFPASLDSAPLLLPLEHLPLRRALDQWFGEHRIAPRVVAEFEDSALLKVFGADGAGLFVAPTVVEPEVAAQHGVTVLGRIPAVRERFYAVSIERRLANPAVRAISEAAREQLFGATVRAPRRSRRPAARSGPAPRAPRRGR